MPTVKIPVKIAYTGAGGPGVNVFNGRVGDVDTDLPDLLAALATFYENLKSIWMTSTTITIGESMILDPYGSPTYIDDDVTVITGTANTNALSPLLAICVSWRTVAASRSGRGRTFLGPLGAQASGPDGTLNDTVLGSVRSEAQTLVSASQATNGWALGVYSTKDALLRDWVGSSVKDQFSYLSSRRD